MNDDGTVQISVRCSDELYERVRARALRDERSISQTIRYALRLYCEESAAAAGPTEETT